MKIFIAARYRLHVAAVSCVLLSPFHTAQAQDVPGYPDSVEAYDPREVAMLPPYCKHTQLFQQKVPGGSDPEQISRWQTILGYSYLNLHHYCWGLMDINRAAFFSDTPQDRKHNLGASIHEFDYVIQHAPSDFLLLPEILTKRAESLIRLDRWVEGMRDLQRAIQIKTDYWPAYAAVSDYYKKNGEPAKAREWLEKGLSVAPDAKALTRRLAEIDAAQSKGKNDPPPPVGR